MHTVLVCDTEPVAIEGIRSLLQDADGFRLTAAEHSLAGGLDAIREVSPALVLLDKAFGIAAVIDFLKTLRQGGDATAAIVWSPLFSDAEALRLLQSGASATVRKTAPLDVLLDCFRTVAAGSRWVDGDLAQHLQAPRLARSALTVRELQVMELVEQGLKNRDIAVTLGIRTGTVKIHLKHIFEKTGIRGRFGLALSGLKEKGMLAVPLMGTS